jgi:hypothetical protein
MVGSPNPYQLHSTKNVHWTLIFVDKWANKGVWMKKIAWKIHTLQHSNKAAGLRLRRGVGKQQKWNACSDVLTDTV